jgi:hypothetical protein
MKPFSGSLTIFLEPCVCGEGEGLDFAPGWREGKASHPPLRGKASKFFWVEDSTPPRAGGWCVP